ncbi:MAG: peptidyl-prolyl cis-trans isomerase [Rubrivivax sp.]|nr:peptidyl-prolyl cis-trans isomerase [Rubrivivax sp.]MBK8528459.1 peptidyl-prolyl cis-trans isomerase [Rubrivivax sp.]
MTITTEQLDVPARINGVPLHATGETLDAETLRQRACTELLRQQAMRCGLLASDDEAALDGSTSEAASAAIEALLDRELVVPDPSDEACRRHFDAQPQRFRSGDRADVRHVLFAVTPGVDVRRLRDRAEAALLELRCHRDGEGDRFPALAAELSNCPSAAQGGALGWLRAQDCAPEFAREIFAAPEIGVLPRLVHSRFGLHVVEVRARESGQTPGFEAVRGAVALALRQQTFVSALRQYLQLLAGGAVIEGVVLDSADTPLVQ